MKEGPPNPIDFVKEKEQKRKEFIALAVELSQNREGFPFPGIAPEAYAKAKAEEEQFPGYATPIDELVKRFQGEGIKVVLGEHPESGNVFILPLQSNDIAKDFVFPRHLQISEGMDEKLKRLILMNKS